MFERSMVVFTDQQAMCKSVIGFSVLTLHFTSRVSTKILVLDFRSNPRLCLTVYNE